MSKCGRAPSPPAPCAVMAMVPEAGTALWSAHCSEASGTREPSGAQRVGGQGRGLPHRSGQLPQEAPPAWPQPLSGCGLEGRPRGPEPLGAPSTPLSRHRCQCALGGRMRDNSTYTGVHAYLFLLFRKKKSPFPVFQLFVVFFLNFSFSSNFRPGSW